MTRSVSSGGGTAALEIASMREPTIHAPNAALLPRAMLGMMVVLSALLGHGQSSDEIDPTGGLRSRGLIPENTSSAKSREELVREWDLDGNGTIDASEVAVARARMRRSRNQLELDNGIDPLTGKPRILADAKPEPEDEPMPEPDLPPEPRAKQTNQPALPGTRVPDPRPSISGTSVPQADETRSSAQRPPASARPGAVIGGVRAGAPEARPGYGSLTPKRDLNAGLRRPDAGTALPTQPRLPRGGLLPSIRPPSARPPTTARPTTPAPPSSRPPPVSADEIGGF